jgi:hypothetical protein
MSDGTRSSGKGGPPASITVQGEVYMRQALIGETIANLDRQRTNLAEAQKRYEQMAATLRSSDEGLAQQAEDLRRANVELAANNRGLEERLAQMTQAPSPHSPTAIEATDSGGRISSPMINMAAFTEQYDTKMREQAEGYDRRIEELMQTIARHETAAKEETVKYRKLEGECRAATEELRTAEETITNLMKDLRKRNDAKLDSVVVSEEGENTLVGVTEPVPPEQAAEKAAGIYETLVRKVIEQSQFSDNKKRSAYYTRLTEQGVSTEIASKIIIDILTDGNIYKALLEEGQKLDDMLQAIFRARHTLDEKRAQIAPLIQRADQIPAEEARLRELGDGLEARTLQLTRGEVELAEKVRQTEAGFAERLAEIDKTAKDAATLQTRERQEVLRKESERLKTYETDLQKREIDMEKGASAIKDGMQALKELALRFRSYYTRQANFSKRLRDLMKDNLRGYQARVDNIKTEKGIGGVVIILNEAYLKKLPQKEGSDMQDMISAGPDTEALTKLRKLALTVPKADQPSLRYDDAVGHYMIHPVITENNFPIAYFCMTGIPEEAKSDLTRLDDLLKTAAAVKHALLTEYTTMHMLSEEGELGYINTRLGSLEKSLGLEPKPA